MSEPGAEFALLTTPAVAIMLLPSTENGRCPWRGSSSATPAWGSSPDGRTLAVGGENGSVSLLDPERGLKDLVGGIGHTSRVSSVTFAPGGDLLFSAGEDGGVLVWDFTRFNETRTHIVERACALADGGMSPEGWRSLAPDVDHEEPCAGVGQASGPVR